MKRKVTRGGAGASDEQTRKRVEELVSAGMPFQMAMSVAKERMSLNEALERMAQRADVDRLMRRHDLSRALATQIALGHADLDVFLWKQRFQRHREEHHSTSCLREAQEDGGAWTFALHGQRRVTGRVLDVTPYAVTLQPTGAPEEEIHKLQFKFGVRAEAFKKVRKLMRTDDALASAPRAPIARPQDRYSCSDKRLFRYIDASTKVVVTLLEGEVFVGKATWFGRYEFGLELKNGSLVTCFRHALHRIEAFD